ncbi:hypothetical protein HA402_009788 [Bradysia odoriphaga]|nr:hypothetical protein HA402_009788 [Bradysia odoriphaga]
MDCVDYANGCFVWKSIIRNHYEVVRPKMASVWYNDPNNPIEEFCHQLWLLAHLLELKSHFTTKPGSLALIIGTTLGLLNQVTGTTCMLTYSATIFSKSGLAFEPNASAMTVGDIKVLSSFFVIILIERAGRRFLLITSCDGLAVSQIVLGVYMMMHNSGYAVEAYNWIPIVAFSAAIFASALGIQGLPVSVAAELMPEKLKEFGATATVTLITSSSFVVLKIFPILGNVIGYHGVMYMFAAFGLFGAAFLIKFLPETKGRSYEEIMNKLR